MSYPLPRGRCLQKSNLINTCSCQRFMVHPLKATSSFDCDGCGHHASFHMMKSHEEEVEAAARERVIEIESEEEEEEEQESTSTVGGDDDAQGRRLLTQGTNSLPNRHGPSKRVEVSE